MVSEKTNAGGGTDPKVLDWDIVRAILASGSGDERWPDAWTWIMSHVLAPVERALIKSGFDEHDAGDAVCTVVARLLQRIEDGMFDIPVEERELFGWTLKSARGAVLDVLRRLRREQSALESTNVQAGDLGWKKEPLFTDKELNRVRECLKELDPGQRSAIELRYCENPRSDSEIAVELSRGGIETKTGVRWTASNVAQARRRGLARIRASIGPRSEGDVCV